ncbi:hypothetical protein [Mariprofundus aestuarium]|uniref:hypothetical protein n=1 Tax=Mariprofundus aestuarium TaxID=1921086 RepID=UPI0012FD084B|nr:hypothetical protein [Mariprofundus aestuarium]
MVLLPDFSQFEIDTDEGIQVILAQLYHQGYTFFSQVKYDHFPFFSVMLTGWFNLFGYQLQVGRMMITLFVALLLWCLVLLIQQRAGWLAAFTASLLLLLDGQFLLMSASLMQSLPFIALGLASLLAIRRSGPLQVGSVAVYVSAALMAMAVMVKLFAVLMVPAMLVELARRPHGGQLVLAWLAGVLFVLLLCTWMIAPALYDPALLHENIRYLLLHHVQPKQWMPDLTLLHLLAKKILYFPILVLAIIAMLRMYGSLRLNTHTDSQVNSKRGIPFDLFPLIWLLCVLVALLFMHPVWYHYSPMLLVPLVWLAALSVGAFVGKQHRDGTFDGWLRQGVRVMLWALILLLPIMIPMRGEQINTQLVEAGSALDEQLLTAIKQHGESPCSMVTDRPIYPFIAGCSVPADHAVVSEKMLQSGLQSEDAYLRAIDLHHPQLVLLARYSQLKQNLPSELKQRGYRRIYISEKAWLYTRDPD